MKLYHSSNRPVPRPETKYSRDYLDFGKGFYLTTLKDQAVKYAARFLRRGQDAWLNVYGLDFDSSEWNCVEFGSYDKAWLDFVAKCRNGQDETEYDMVAGGIANDKVIRTLDRYFEGEISEETALGLLKYEKPNHQLCIRSQEMLDRCLTHIESVKL